MTGTGLLREFEKLNEKKRADACGLNVEESARWRELRNQIERALFQYIPQPQAERRESLRCCPPATGPKTSSRTATSPPWGTAACSSPAPTRFRWAPSSTCKSA
jgi:hypothetical protein